MTKKLVKPGDFLVAEPFLPDPNFNRSVVYMVEQNEKGSLGFVLNQPLGLTLKDVIPNADLPELDIPVYNGGPVGTDTLHVVHQLGDHVENSQHIKDHIYWGGDFEQIKFLLSNKNANWNEFKFFVGYSGWAAGQLEEELKLKSWIICNSSDHFVFSTELDTLWKDVMQNLKPKYSMMANSPFRAEWN